MKSRSLTALLPLLGLCLGVCICIFMSMANAAESPHTANPSALSTTQLTSSTSTATSSSATTAASSIQYNPPTPYPITRLGHVIYIDCDFELLSFNPGTDAWEPADYIEPEFEVMPDNVLWVIEPERSYQMHVDFGDRIQNIPVAAASTANTKYSFDVIYTGLLPEGSLGTFQVEFSEQIDDVFVVYRGVLKFVADDGAELFCAPNASLDAEGKFTAEFRPRSEATRYFQQTDEHTLDCVNYNINTSFQADVPVTNILDHTQTTVYDSDLSHYLYPHGVPHKLQWYFDQFPMETAEPQPVG